MIIDHTYRGVSVLTASDLDTLIDRLLAAEAESGQTPVSKDSPLWLAWERYKATDDYANTKRWASISEHTDGSLWAAFEAGRASAEAEARALREKVDMFIERCADIRHGSPNAFYAHVDGFCKAWPALAQATPKERK